MLFASYCNCSIRVADADAHHQNTISDTDHQSMHIHTSHCLCEMADDTEVDEEQTDEQDEHASLLSEFQVYLALISGDQESNHDKWFVHGHGMCMGELYLLHHSWKGFLLA